MLTAEPKGYGSNWYATTRVDSPARPRLSVELDVEVCVIGAGLAGLTVALEVARLGWSVVVLESKSVAWSASGRNTGVVLPGFGAGVDALIERVGLKAAKALWERSAAGAEYVRNAARDMPGTMLNEGGWLHVSKTDRTGAMAHEAALLAGEFGAAVEPWPADRVREVLRSPRYFHGLHYPRGFSLHPLNYALGLAAAAEASGARIFEDTPVLEIDPAGVRKRVVTSHSRIRAAHVVLAGSAHVTELAPQFASTLLAVFSTVVITAPLGDELPATIRYPGAVSDEAEFAGHHYRVIGGRSLMWSGRSLVWLDKPSRQGETLLRQIRRTYPALRGAKVEQVWIGVAGRTVHGMPQIGEITPGLWLLSGFGGHGLSTTAMGGEILARAIVHNDRTWEMFSQFPLVWAGGAFGRWAQQVSGWSRRSQQTLGGMLAYRRSAVWSRPEPVVAAETAAASPEPIPEPPQVRVEPVEAPVPQREFTAPLEPPVVKPDLTAPVEAPVPQRELTAPLEPPVVKPDLAEPVEAPAAQPEFIEPVRARLPHPEIVERIRALIGRPEIAAIEPPRAAGAEETSAVPREATYESPVTAGGAPPIPAAPVELAVRNRPKRGPKKRKAPRLLQELTPQTAGSGNASAEDVAPLTSPDVTDQAPPSLVDKKV